ncbi:SDR family NAD(P)-dependent oxidoreductase [Sphingomonas jatrophae]|uniref:NAD(P)-dependent dehydrogenase, short-chain alcohol dehydrogenase family n=1 Tax=Sphingomonas jatrophae TaxID=1166337 RepID=A0A1I6M428_9SPHN|nr:SDR family oxidoreductase [Sphingomonas jatrophae]SFS10424.1 NAD(P)-dependent dehydrogenase, short-chain alcohol dehydrogenase family [Sphingomonas jatrophae]
MRLQGKRALLAGASTADGMGAAIARRFVAEGAQVVLGGRNAEKTAAAGAALGLPTVQLDITDEASLAAGVKAAAQALGGLDIAINLAGVNHSSLIADETYEGLLEQAKLHFVGTSLFIRDVAAAMTNGGSIITISSLTVELTGPRFAAYAGSKAAADKVVRVAAVEYGERGIRVNSLAPGLTRTRMTGAYFENPALREAFERETPTGHLAEPEDVAAAALWLASDECTATGDLVRVSGGMHLRRLPTPRDFAS